MNKFIPILLLAVIVVIFVLWVVGPGGTCGPGLQCRPPTPENAFSEKQVGQDFEETGVIVKFMPEGNWSPAKQFDTLEQCNEAGLGKCTSFIFSVPNYLSKGLAV